MGLTWRLCDLWGNTLQTITNRFAATVTIPLSASGVRTAAITLNVNEPAVAKLTPLATTLKATYQSPLGGPVTPVFCGLILKPDFQDGKQSGVQDQVVINAISVGGFRLGKCFLDPPADPGNPYVFTLTNTDQGQIITALLGVGQSKWTAAGFPPGLGVIAGTVEMSSVIDRQYEPGQQLWDAICGISEIVGGVDFDLQPLDQSDGVFEQLNVFAQMGRDLTSTVRFEHGWGKDNAAIDWTPDGTPVVNRSIYLGQGENGMIPPYYISSQPDSQTAIGPYENATARSDISDIITLSQYAQGEAATYAFPVDTFTVGPRVEPETTQVTYGTPPPVDPSLTLSGGYWLGDTVSAVRQIDTAGSMKVKLTGRITQIVLSEIDPAGGNNETGDVWSTIQCMPTQGQYVVT